MSKLSEQDFNELGKQLMQQRSILSGQINRARAAGETTASLNQQLAELGRLNSAHRTEANERFNVR
jgi:hypothetical protein